MKIPSSLLQKMALGAGSVAVATLFLSAPLGAESEPVSPPASDAAPEAPPTEPAPTAEPTPPSKGEGHGRRVPFDCMGCGMG